MKAVIVTIALSLLLPCAEAAAADRAASPSAVNSAATARKGTRMTIPVEGVTCESCAKRLSAMLQKLDGVKSVTVSVAHKQAVIEFEPTKFTAARAVELINDIGFTAGTPVEG